MSPTRIVSSIIIILLYLVLYPLALRMLTNMFSESLISEFSYGLIQGWFFSITAFLILIAIGVGLYLESNKDKKEEGKLALKLAIVAFVLWTFIVSMILVLSFTNPELGFGIPPWQAQEKGRLISMATAVLSIVLVFLILRRK